MFSIQCAGTQGNGERNATIETITDSGIELVTCTRLADQKFSSENDGVGQFKHLELGRDHLHAEVSPHTTPHVRGNAKVYFKKC